MAVLTAAQRKRIPSHQYGIPPKDGKKGRYPINDKAHATAALRLINRGKGVTSADKARIRRLANKMLGKSMKDKKGSMHGSMHSNGGSYHGSSHNGMKDKKMPGRKRMSATSRMTSYARGM